MYKQEYIYLGIALSGVYACGETKYGENSKTTCSIEIPDRRLTPYLGNMKEGSFVVDKRTCAQEDIIHWVISGPMVDFDLPEKTRKDWDKIVACSDIKECSSMNYVSFDLYIDLWRSLGARVGKRVGDVIKWENGEETIIPEFDCRWQWDSWVVK